MRVTLVQTFLAWGDPRGGRAHFTRLLAPLAGTTDLVVLPETFTTGFDMRGGERAESMDGPTCQWLRAEAQRLDAALLGSVFIRDAAGVHNRALWATPDGALAHYDKRHLFRMAGEHQHYAAGEAAVTVEWRGARIAPLVCYDLRFPVWSRRRAGYDYDLLVYVANWPAPRHLAWQRLLRARAIENQAYVVGVNRVGDDGNGIAHRGGSAAIEPLLGEPLVELGDTASLATVTLDLAALRDLRARFPVALDADAFELGSPAGAASRGSPS
ncbi:MAG: Omega-amidase YafV [Steroidobacteraceae bacterium]|nr:Omega-amidase YafV [Steroidobacteraceae bacterium]